MRHLDLSIFRNLLRDIDETFKPIGEITDMFN